MISADRTCPLTHPDSGTPTLPADRYVCTGCTGALRGLLTDLGGLMDDLDTALSRQARFTAQRGGVRPDDTDPEDERRPQTAAVTPLPFAVGPSEAGWVARQTILVWVDWVAGVRGHTVPQTWGAVGEYLHAATDWIARHPDGPMCIDELIAALRNARHAVDRPADLRYLGLCAGTRIDATGLAHECDQALYGGETASVVTCPRCGTPWPAADLHARQVARIEGHQLAAADAERVLAQIGVDVPARLIRLWRHRKQIVPSGVDRRGRPLYRLGDILGRHARSA